MTFTECESLKAVRPKFGLIFAQSPTKEIFMNTIWFGFFIWWTSTGLWAQTATQDLASAEKRFKQAKSLAAVVEFNMGGHVDTGYVYYKGNLYHLDFPTDQTIFDGKRVMNWSKEFAAIHVAEPGNGLDLSLGGVYSLHRNPAFKLSHSGSAGQFKLSSQYAEEVVDVVGIQLNAESGLVEAYQIKMTSGIQISYRVLNQQLDAELDNHLFEIDEEFVAKVERGEVPPVENKN